MVQGLDDWRSTVSDNTAPNQTRSDPTNVGLVLVVLAVGAAFALSVAAIFISRDDGSETAGSGGAPASVHVVLTEFAIDPGSITIAQDGVLHVENTGSTAHNIAVVGEDYKISDLAAGDSGELDLAGLAPGEYTVICTIAGHESAGMTGTLTVVAGGGSAEEAAGDAGDTATGHSEHGADMGPELAAKLDKAMEDTLTAFPAETEGVGNEALEPEVLEDGTKRFELTADITEWEVEPGKVVEAWTYNGQVPGPQIFLEVGDEVEIELTNELPLSTDLHMHGVKLPNDMDGVAPLTQPPIRPGESFTYRFTAQAPAVAMYHAHMHGQTSVPNGLLGMMYIGDMPLPAGQTIGGKAVPADVEVSQELPMVLNDAGVIGFALNGKSFPATAPIVGKQGDWIMVHYANEGVQTHPMHLHQMDQIVIAKDGLPLDEPYRVDTLNVGPGERYTVLFQMESPGTWVWHCHILPHVERETGMFGMVTAIVVE
jgi:plastocyanin